MKFLPIKKLEWLAEAFTKLKYQSIDEVIFSNSLTEHNPNARNFFIVFRGSVEIKMKSEVLKILKPGDHYGDIDLFLGSTIIEKITAVTHEEGTVIYMLKRTDYISLVEPEMRRMIQNELIVEKPELKNLIIISKDEGEYMS